MLIIYLCFTSESGSSSSGSVSGNQSGTDRSHSGEDRSNQSNDTKSQQPSNHNSQSEQHSDKDWSDDSHSKPEHKNNKIKSNLWEDHPDIYGIRRSSRSRKEPDRLKVADSDSSERGKSNSRKGRSRR